MLLIQAAQNGDRAAFTQLVTQYQHLIFNTVLGMVQQTEETEDITQEVFIQAYLHINGFRGDAKFSTWLYRIAVTKALEFERKKKAKKRFNGLKKIMGLETIEESVPDFHHPGVVFHQKEEASILFKALQQLPENQKTAFVLIKTEGLSYEEVSQVLNTSIKAVEALMHRAKENLRKLLQEHYSK